MSCAYITYLFPHASPSYIPDSVHNNKSNYQKTLTYNSTPTQPKDLTKRLFQPLRHQQGIWSMNRIQTYCPLYHDAVHNDPLDDHDLQYHTPSTVPRETPIINISSVRPCPKRERLFIQKSCTIIYIYRCGHKKIITFNIPPLDSPSNSLTTSPVSPYSVINQTYNFQCLTITSLQNKLYTRPIQNTMTHVIHNSICHQLVSFTDLPQLITPNHHTPPMLCLNIIKIPIASKETNGPVIRPFQLRCRHIRSIQVAPKCIHTKQKLTLDKGNNTPNTKKYDSATSRR